MRVRVHDGLKLARANRLFPPHPVVVEVRQIEPHRVAIIPNQLLGQGQLVEVLVPRLRLDRRLKATEADTRIRRVEERQGTDACRDSAREDLRDGCLNVVSGDDERVQAKVRE